MGEYKPPEFEADAFNCPHCEAYAHQRWPDTKIEFGHRKHNWEGVSASMCDNCGKSAIWVSEELVFPKTSVAPLPNEDMPEEVLSEYKEARKVVGSSPRSAAALLRLAIEKLLNHIGAEGATTNKMIGDLVSKGLDESVQKALDSVRVIGNESVHPGDLDMEDDKKTALALFKLINLIARQMITEEKKIEEVWNKLPESKKEGIEDRDKSPS